MVDNTELNIGTGGDIISTDDLGGGVKVQRVKIQYGTDGNATDVSDSNPIPIDDAGGSITVDNAGLTSLDGAITGTEVQVDIVASIPTGTNSIGRLAANSGVDIGDVDVTSLLPGATSTALGKAVDNASTGADVGVAMLAIRDDALSALTPAQGDYVQLRVDSTGALHTTGTGSSSVNTTAQIPGTGATNLGKAISSASGATDTGVALLGVRDDTLTTLSEADGEYTPLRVTSTGELHVVTAAGTGGTASVDDAAFTIATDSGTPVMGVVTTDSVDNGDAGAVAMSTDRRLRVSIDPVTSGGSTFYKNLDVDQSEDSVKSSAGQIYWIHAFNKASTPNYLKFYDATVGTVVVGTTIPDLTFAIPSQGDANGAGFVLAIPQGIAFGTAITIAATTGWGDASTGAPATNDVIVNIGYK